MKYGKILAVAGLVLLGSVAGRIALADHHEGGASPATVTLEGEVVDLHCFMLHPDTGQGPEHIQCAKTCMNKGLPIGFLSGGQVYLLLSAKHDSVKSQVIAVVGLPVTLKGTLVEHHGAKAIQVVEVKKAGGKADASKPADKPMAKDVWMCPMGCAKSDKPGKCPACGMDMEKQKKG